MKPGDPETPELSELLAAASRPAETGEVAAGRSQRGRRRSSAHSPESRPVRERAAPAGGEPLPAPTPAERPVGETPRGSARPGATLKQARELAKLTAQDVAAQMMLDLRVINALEADAYERLPSPAYVRGYLRSYARLLDLDPAPLIASYNEFAVEAPALHPAASEPPQQVRSSDKPVILTTVLVVATLVALALTWWHSNRGSQQAGLGPQTALEETAGAPTPELFEAPAPAPASTTVPPTPAPADVAAAPQGVDPAAVGLVPGATAPTATVQTAAAPTSVAPGSALPTAAAPTSVAPGSALPTAAAPTSAVPGPALPTAAAPTSAVPGPALPTAALTPGTQPTEPAAGDEPLSGDEDELPPVEGAPTDAAPAPAASPLGPGEGRLELRIGSQEVWMEVSDAAGRKLFAGTARPGTVVDAAGRLPLRAVIGRAEQVQATYNGKPLDLSPFAFSGVARFSIDVDGVPQ